MPSSSATPSHKKPRVVVAGQIPPPQGGQNIMVERILRKLQDAPDLDTLHLPFFFTTDFRAVRSAGIGKLVELVRVIGRLVRIRMTGPVDCLIYPSGGPQTVPVVRDILLLPWILLFSKKVVIQFHAAGIADRISEGQTVLTRILAWLYEHADAAIVMTDFNRRDPEALGMHRIFVLPHRLKDESSESRVEKEVSTRTLLYVGHLCPDKGTPALVEAFSRIHGDDPSLRLQLVGECLPPYSGTELQSLIARHGLEEKVILSGVLSGEQKWEAFAGADLFVFPSVAPYESFGLVLVEAMMCGLPIVCSDWRGNRDVVGDEGGALLYDPASDHASHLEAALRSTLEGVPRWSSWAALNRKRFEAIYDLGNADAASDYHDLVVEIVSH